MASMIPQPGQVMAWTMDLWRRALLAAEQAQDAARGGTPGSDPGPAPRPPSDPSAPPQVW